MANKTSTPPDLEGPMLETKVDPLPHPSDVRTTPYGARVDVTKMSEKERGDRTGALAQSVAESHPARPEGHAEHNERVGIRGRKTAAPRLSGEVEKPALDVGSVTKPLTEGLGKLGSYIGLGSSDHGAERTQESMTRKRRPPPVPHAPEVVERPYPQRSDSGVTSSITQSLSEGIGKAASYIGLGGTPQEESTSEKAKRQLGGAAEKTRELAHDSKEKVKEAASYAETQVDQATRGSRPSFTEGVKKEAEGIWERGRAQFDKQIEEDRIKRGEMQRQEAQERMKSAMKEHVQGTNTEADAQFGKTSEEERAREAENKRREGQQQRTEAARRAFEPAFMAAEQAWEATKEETKAAARKTEDVIKSMPEEKAQGHPPPARSALEPSFMGAEEVQTTTEPMHISKRLREFAESIESKFSGKKKS